AVADRRAVRHGRPVDVEPRRASGRAVLVVVRGVEQLAGRHQERGLRRHGVTVPTAAQAHLQRLGSERATRTMRRRGMRSRSFIAVSVVLVVLLAAAGAVYAYDSSRS